MYFLRNGQWKHRPFCFWYARSRRRRAIGFQNFASEIEGPCNQNTRRGIEPELADHLQRLRYVFRRIRWNADVIGSERNARRRQCLVLMNGNRDQLTRQPGEIAQETFLVFRRQHADDHYQRARNALLKIGKYCSRRTAAIDVMPAVKPEFGTHWCE